MKKTLLCAALAVAFAPAVLAEWEMVKNDDPMDGTVNVFVSSAFTPSMSKMNFPYEGTEAQVVFGCDGAKEWAYFDFTKKPNMTDQTVKNRYNHAKLRLKSEVGVNDIYVKQPWGDKHMFTQRYKDDRTIIANMLAGEAMVLEVPWYGNGNVYFKFDTTEAHEAVTKARGLCLEYYEYGSIVE